MNRYRSFGCVVLFLCALFPVIFLLQHRGIEQMGFQGNEFLRLYLGSGAGYNGIGQHGFLYITIELFLLLQILPRINEQRLVRMTRAQHWRQTWKAMGVSAGVFCLVFCMVQFVMTAVCVADERLWESGFVYISILNFLRLICVYMIFNGVFILMYSVLFREEVAAMLCVLLFIFLFYVLGGRWGIDVFRLAKDMAVYDAYYSTEGLELTEYLLATLKQVLGVALLYLGSLSIFEKKDILYEGKK